LTASNPLRVLSPYTEIGAELRPASWWLLRAAAESLWIVPNPNAYEPGIDPIPRTTVLNHLWLEAGGRWSLFELSAGAGMWFVFGSLPVIPSLRLRAAVGHPASWRLEAAVSGADQMPLFVSAAAQVPVGSHVYLVADWGLAGLYGGGRVRIPTGGGAFELSAMVQIASPYQLSLNAVKGGVEYQW
jgi:hypothetical protein